MCSNSELKRPDKPLQRGLTLIELLVFIVITGIAATSLVSVMGNLGQHSAALLPDKQAQTLADGLLDEILAQPFTYCDPDDANAATATSAAACASLAENLGPEAGETRGGATPFDNVNDYNGFGPAPPSFPNAAPIPDLAVYQVQASVQSAGAIAGVPAADTLRVTVTVTPPNGAPIRQQVVRVRFAPNP